MYYRLIKPDWAKRTKANGDLNPNFVEEIPGADVYEGVFNEVYLKKMNKMGYNIYYFPNYPSKAPENEHLSGKHIDKFTAVFVDMDLKDKQYSSKEDFLKTVGSFALKPSRVVDSGNGIHVYWYVNNLTRETYVELQLRLIQLFKTDDSIWTPLQLMRCPGYMNTKAHADYKKAVIVEESKSQYSVEEVSKTLPPITTENKRKADRHIAKLNGTYKPVMEYTVSDLDSLPEKFIDLMARSRRVKALFTDPLGAGNYTDRSSADMALCNKLYTADFTRKESYQVLLNTLKAKSRQDREEYAQNIVEKVYSDRPQDVAQNVNELLEGNSLGAEGMRIHGPDFWDCTEWGWRKGEVLGIIAGTGVGKTALSLVALKHFIQRPENKDKDWIHFFFSLEMPARQIIKRWKKLCGNDKECFSKLYIVDNRNKNSRIGWQEVYKKVRETCNATGKDVGCVIVDHMRALSNRVDTNKTPHFDLNANMETGWGTEKTATEKDMCRIMDDVAEMLDCFLIVQNQSSKATAEEGDVPMGVNAGYGTTFFAWHCDYIITVWQPLRRIQDQTNLTVTGWQYCKIREQDEGDGTKIYSRHVLFYDLSTGDLRKVTQDEFEEFKLYIGKAIEIRKAEKTGKSGSAGYQESPGSTTMTPGLLKALQS